MAGHNGSDRKALADRAGAKKRPLPVADRTFKELAA
jgi:hypothetical protein